MIRILSLGIYPYHNIFINNYGKMFHFINPAKIILLKGILGEGIKISFSAVDKILLMTAIFAYTSCIIWAVFLHFILEKPYNKLRYNFFKKEKQIEN